MKQPVQILVIVAMLMATGLFGQPLRFRHYSSDEGFTGGGFKIIVQDSLGFIWIGSGSGLSKFDGYNFTEYKANPQDTLSIPAELVSRLWIDPAGHVWAGLAGYLIQYDRDRDGFIRHRFRGPPNTILFESDRLLWIGTSKELIRFDPLTHAAVGFQLKDETAAGKSIVINDIKDGGEFLLLGTSDGLWQFYKTQKMFYKVQTESFPSILKIFALRNHYWLWSAAGLHKTDLNFKPIQEFNFGKITEKFPDARKPAIASVELDASGNFWLASQGSGLFQFNSITNELTNHRYDPENENSIPSDVLTSVMADRDQNIWIGSAPKGIVKVSRQSLQFHNYLVGKPISGLSMTRSNLIAGSNGHGLWEAPFNAASLDKLTFKKFTITPAIEGSNNIVNVRRIDNKVWIGTLETGAITLNINPLTGSLLNPAEHLQHDPDNINSLSTDFVVAAGYVKDDDGNILIGTFNKGLNKVVVRKNYGTEGSVVRYHRDNKPDSSAHTDDSIMDIVPDGEGSFWVTSFGGLDRFSGGKFRNVLSNISVNRIYKVKNGALMLTTKAGLYEGRNVDGKLSFRKVEVVGSPFITCLEEDKLGRFWLLTFEGIFFYDSKRNYVLKFKKEDGLPSSRCLSGGRTLQTDEGFMIFSNSEGLAMFDPMSLKLSDVRPKPIITRITINNSLAGRHQPHNSSAETLRLDYTQNILVLEFAAMDFTAPEKSQYRYMLEGFDTDWVGTDWKNRTATYTNLKAGNYTFKVAATNRDGLMGDHVASLAITVLPPPWRTWWAYSAYGLLFAVVLLLARRSIVRQERLKSNLRLEKVEREKEHLELEKVQEIDKAKTNFFANISHEFRTPLTLIQGPAQNLLERFGKDEATGSQLRLISQNADRLLRLVNQILELAKLESGGLKKEFSQGDIVSFLVKLSDSFSAAAIQKKIALVRRFPNQDIRASFDQDKLEKIVSNLISNALKFTPEGGTVTIAASLVDGDAVNGMRELRVHIEDTGRGIAPEQADRIFERFYQVSEDGTPNAGTGIGLALSKDLAEFLGGSLSLESRLGSGSRFTLLIPLNVLEVKDHAVLDGPREGTSFAVGSDLEADKTPDIPVLLIVEDHVDLRKFIIGCLGTDYQFMEAGNGKEGLRLAIEHVPSLVLSDVMMPEMDGIDMCREIKQDHRTCHIPVILLTAKAGDESKFSGLGTGAEDYLIKPFKKEELVLKIRNQIHSRTMMQEKLRLELLSGSTVIEAVSEDEKFLESVKQVIESRINDEQLSVESLAEQIGLSRVQLYRKVTALTGIPVNDFIRKLRMHKAAQLLLQNWGAVAQVAFEVGFSNPSYFTKCFKEEFGVLPSEYTGK